LNKRNNKYKHSVIILESFSLQLTTISSIQVESTPFHIKQNVTWLLSTNCQVVPTDENVVFEHF